MSSYRRLRIAGGTYFFTVNLADRRTTLLTDRVDLLRQAFAGMQLRQPVRVDAMVVLPDHLHAVWTLPEGDSDFSSRWRRVKYSFVRLLRPDPSRLPRSSSKRAKREVGLWQRRFWEHAIRDEADFATHVAYCWVNPVRHGLVERAADWPYSSIHRDIRLGRVDPRWTTTVPEGSFGE